MPTSKPRYVLTDTGEVAGMLDAAAERWPEASSNRKALVLRLLRTGRDALASEVDAETRRSLRRRLDERFEELVDPERLSSDTAWR